MGSNPEKKVQFREGEWFEPKAKIVCPLSSDHGWASFVDIQSGIRVFRRHFEKSTISDIKNALKQSPVYIAKPVSYTVTLF